MPAGKPAMCLDQDLVLEVSPMWHLEANGKHKGNSGKLSRATCDAIATSEFYCLGFLCECDDASSVHSGHGESPADPCPNAKCHHCGWSGWGGES